MRLKVWSIIAAVGLAGVAHALTVDGVEVTASISVQDGGLAWRGVTYDLPDTLADWVLFDGTSITVPIEQKAGTNLLTNLVEGVSPGALIGNELWSLKFSWSDGDPTASATNDHGVKSVANVGAFLTWDVELPELTGDTTGYEMQYYTVDKRRYCSMQVSTNTGEFATLLSEDGNDEQFLRLWTVKMDGYTGSKTLTFRYYVDVVEAGVGGITCFGGITLKALGGESSVLVLNPDDQLGMTLTAPATTVTNTIDASVNFGADTNNVVITGITIDNAMFSSLDIGSLPITVSSNETLSIEFDASTFSIGDTATADMVISWVEQGTTVTNESQLAVSGTMLAPATGTIDELGTTVPSSNIVFECSPSKAIGEGVKRLSGDYRKVCQEIKASELGGVSEFDAILLPMRETADLTGASSANQLQIWFGKINEADGTVAETLALETFECSGQVFTIHNYYQFNLSAPVDFSASNLAAGESYGFQVWWASDDPGNSFSLWRGNTNAIAGGFIAKTASDTTFPVTMNGLIENRDLLFALSMTQISPVDDLSVAGLDEFGNLITSFSGEAGGLYAMQRTLSLTITNWVTVEGNLTGVGTINVTNDTTESEAFYRVILQ